MCLCTQEPATANPGSLGRCDHMACAQSKAGSGGGRAGLQSQGPHKQRESYTGLCFRTSSVS